MSQSHITISGKEFPKIGEGIPTKPENKAVEIRVSTTSRGKTIQAYNYTQSRYVGVGSVSGATYEKGNCSILKMVRGEYCPSFALTVSELEAVRTLGATFLRCISPDGVTHAISLSDFEKHAERYTNAYYGEQLATSLEYFAKTTRTGDRNAVLDNPPLMAGTVYERPQPQQLDFFASRARYDEQGNYRG